MQGAQVSMEINQGAKALLRISPDREVPLAWQCTEYRRLENQSSDL
jgi:hypothetical protein